MSVLPLFLCEDPDEDDLGDDEVCSTCDCVWAHCTCFSEDEDGDTPHYLSDL